MARKRKIAGISGYFQIFLATVGIAEVIKRFILKEKLPDFQVIIIVSLLALIANAFSYYILQKSKSNEPHIKASKIFTSNDIFVNIGVIIAGILVFLTKSPLPDLIVGIIIFLIVIRGAFKILQLKKV